jgi:hypothetical protein
MRSAGRDQQVPDLHPAVRPSARLGGDARLLLAPVAQTAGAEAGSGPALQRLPEGRSHVAATEVDHLQRHRGPDDPLFWIWSNLDSKCKPCHSRKTAGETMNGGDGGIAGKRDVSDRVRGNLSDIQLGEPAIG